MLFVIYLSLLFLCAATGIFAGYYRRNVPFYLKLFAWFVFVTLVIEIPQKYFFHNYVQGFYNVYSLLEFAILGYLLYQVVESESIKRVILLAEYIICQLR